MKQFSMRLKEDFRRRRLVKRKNGDRPRTRIAVLGLYRSGSSAVAGALHHLGVDMGKPFWGEFYEPADLAHQLRLWWSVTELVAMSTAAERIAGLASWVERREQAFAGAVGAKHPLLSLCGPELLAAWGGAVRFIWSYRALDLSIRSLAACGWWPGRETFIQQSLWRAVSEFFSRQEHLRVDFADMTELPAREIARIAEYAGLRPEPTQMSAAIQSIRPDAKVGRAIFSPDGQMIMSSGTGKASLLRQAPVPVIAEKTGMSETQSNHQVPLNGRAQSHDTNLKRKRRSFGGASGSYNQQAISYSVQGRHDEAVACLKEALRLRPDFDRAHNNLGIVLFCQGRYEGALESYETALRLKPDHAETHNNLANTLSALGRHAEAVAHCKKALRLRPGFAQAYNNLGNAYQGLVRLNEAVACYKQALEQDPKLAEARNNLGVALASLNQFDLALANYQEALRLNPDYADAWSNLGNALVQRGSWDSAVAALRRAIRLKPKNAEVHYNLGCLLRERSRTGAAGNHFRKALRLKPDYAGAHFALALNLLAQGDFEQGWQEYEWRWRLNRVTLPPFRQPIWDGSSLAGRTILLYSEGGVGDTIQFVRYAAVVKRLGATVILGCREHILPLLKSCPGIDRFVAAGSVPPDFDVQISLMSLPRVLKTALSTVPAEIPYLRPDAKLQQTWHRRLSRCSGFKIGIAWQGNPENRHDRQRSIPLAHFARLARIDGVSLISLQKGLGTEQLRAAADSFRVLELGAGLDKRSGAFMDTAAVMKSLDLVITADTSIGHLAGALGVPVWIALAFMPDWRWLLHREDSPWYPTMRLFRQSKPGDWDGVFARMAEELESKIASRPRARSVTVKIAPGELIDKITILEIKRGKIRDAAKRRHVRAELAALRAVCDRDIGRPKEITLLTSQLKAINERLWQTEDELRLCEQAQDFGPRFVELARSVYQQNDRRSLLKRRINDLLGSSLVEEKVYITRK
jgi:tetratricopeptide (TPR) repeat protein